MQEEIVRVLRVIEYVGPRAWVEDTVAKSIHGIKDLGQGRQIMGATVGAYPEILKPGPNPADLLAALKAILPYAETRCEDLTEAKEAGEEDPTCPGADRAWLLLNEAAEAIAAAEAGQS